MIDWKKHPKAAYADVTFFDKHHCDVGSQLDISRPTQTKTVADAVEWAKSKDSPADWNHIRVYDVSGDLFFALGKVDSDGWVNSKLVCTREQFEAYVKEKEGEKWTHTYNDEQCYIATTYNDCAWIVRRFRGDIIVDMDKLKPIKPTISEAEAIGILMVNKHLSFAALLEDYDVVKD